METIEVVAFGILYIFGYLRVIVFILFAPILGLFCIPIFVVEAFLHWLDYRPLYKKTLTHGAREKHGRVPGQDYTHWESDEAFNTHEDLEWLELELISRKAKEIVDEDLEKLRASAIALIPLFGAIWLLLKAVPRPYLMEEGDCYIYPTSKGKCWNSHFGTIEEKAHVVDWVQDGWGVMIVAERGRAFEFLTWYRPLVITATLSERPTADTIYRMPGWVLENPGTLTTSHFKRKQLEKIAQLPIDIHKLDRLFPKRRSGTYSAINDIGIGNWLDIPSNATERKNELKNLGDILS